MGVCVALSGPGAGLKSVGLISGPWMMAVGAGGGRKARGPEAMVHKAAGLRGLARNPAGRALESCFCRASLVCMVRHTRQDACSKSREKTCPTITRNSIY